MNSKFCVAEDGHIVNILPPIDITGGATTTDAWSMKYHAHASVVIQMGVTGAASTVTVEECTDAAGTGATAIPFIYYAETTAAGDTLSAKNSATAAGFATSTNNSIMYVIEIDAGQLSSTKPFLRVVFSNPGASTIASAAAILSGSRYAGNDLSVL